MVACGICAFITVFVWIRYRKKLSCVGKKMVYLFLFISVMGFVIGVKERQQQLVDSGRLARKEVGEGDYEKSVTLQIEGEEDELDYHLIIPEQLLTDEEKMQAIETAKKELLAEFQGNNPSLNHVENEVILREEYVGGKVSAQWNFDEYGVVDEDGNIILEDIPEDGVLVRADVLLSCGDREETISFYFRVFPPQRSRREMLLAEIEDRIENEGALVGKDYIELPAEVDGKAITWHVKKEYTAEKLLFLGCLVVMIIPIAEQTRQREQREARRNQLMLEYPNLVNKLALLMSAGMTVKKAFQRIAVTYENKRNEKLIDCSPAYEEMLITCREIENGMGESRAYERFGERCGGAMYRRLGNLLAQSLRKGNAGLIILLEQEAERAFEERKATARKYGEEAGTKMLFPMIMMLGLVMIVLIIPAMMTIQM